MLSAVVRERESVRVCVCVRLLGSFACQSQTEAAFRAVVQEAAVVPFLLWRPRWRARPRQHGSCLRRAGWAGGV